MHLAQLRVLLRPCVLQGWEQQPSLLQSSTSVRNLHKLLCLESTSFSSRKRQSPSRDGANGRGVSAEVPKPLQHGKFELQRHLHSRQHPCSPPACRYPFPCLIQQLPTLQCTSGCTWAAQVQGSYENCLQTNSEIRGNQPLSSGLAPRLKFYGSCPALLH